MAFLEQAASHELHRHLNIVLQAALDAADAGRAVERALRSETNALAGAGLRPVSVGSVGHCSVVAAGKAACAMVRGAQSVLGEPLRGGTCTTRKGYAAAVPGVELWEAGHPLPDAHSLAGAADALRWARRAGAADLVLCLLSGGASALWAAPPRGVLLGDVRDTTALLLRSGAPIQEVNAVRKHLSRIAGGQLARAAFPARVLTLIVSDVVGSPVDVIASGPTVADPTTFADALDVLGRRNVAAPTRVVEYLRRGAAGVEPETAKPGAAYLARAAHAVIADNPLALRAAAAKAEHLGYHSEIQDAALQGEARAAGERIARRVRQLAGSRPAGTHPVALLFGGETTVTVTGSGLGGRNQELALAAAIQLQGLPGVAVAALGTDGTDGPTDAAGARVDGNTLARAAGMDAVHHLLRNDAYPFLRTAGDLLFTGPTRTNVADLVVALVA